MERIFQILAVVLVGVAAFFLWYGNPEMAFVTAALGSVAFFISIRFQVKERVDKRNAEIIKEKYGEGFAEELKEFDASNIAQEKPQDIKETQK